MSPVEKIFLLIALLGLLGILIEWIGQELHKREQRKKQPREPRAYPRIVWADGVWCAEIQDFGTAHIEQAPGHWTVMSMKDARSLKIKDDR